jgi:Neuraminidase (sialidase)
MPASLLLRNGDILVVVRAGHGHDYTMETYKSKDLGRTWGPMKVATAFKDNAKNHLGNPGTLNQLADGRIAMTYGNRDVPYTIDAKISDDNGETWGPTIQLRTGGGSHDLGYPRTVAAANGTLVTAYYFNENRETERFIGATRWRP